MPRDRTAQLDDQPPPPRLSHRPVNYQRQRVDLYLVNKNIDLNKVTLLETGKLIIHRRITVADTLEHIVKIVNDLSKRSLILQQHTGLAKIIRLHQLTPPTLRKFHYPAYRVRTRYDLKLNERFAKLFDMTRIRHHTRRIDTLDLTVAGDHLVTNRRRSLNNLCLMLTLQAFLNDLHMQKTEKATPKTKTQCRRTLRNKRKTRIVHSQLIECRPKLRIIGIITRIKI